MTFDLPVLGISIDTQTPLLQPFTSLKTVDASWASCKWHTLCLTWFLLPKTVPSGQPTIRFLNWTFSQLCNLYLGDLLACPTVQSSIIRHMGFTSLFLLALANLNTVFRIRIACQILITLLPCGRVMFLSTFATQITCFSHVIIFVNVKVQFWNTWRGTRLC